MDATALIQSEARLALGAPVAPAYVYSERVLRAAARAAANVAQAAGCRLLYTLKACAVLPVLRILGERVDGFACSSAYETRLARLAARPEQSAHAYSPAFSDSEIADTLANADFLSLNSFSQMAKALRIASETPDSASLGIRINPEIRFADDERYDPCRPHSKLGVLLSDFAERARRSGAAHMLEGAHMHSNCESDDLGELARTADALAPALDALTNLRWVNLGGGYYIDEDSDAKPLASAIARLKSERGAEVFIEPGTALVQSAGFLVAQTLDVFDSGGVDVAVLDASTSHLPEVFEYGFAPRIVRQDDADDDIRAAQTAARPTILAGKTCLAGDMFGRYNLPRPVRAGERIAIMDAGSYAHSRAAPFNGVPIPSVFILRENGDFEMVSEYGFADFARRNGALEAQSTNLLSPDGLIGAC